MTSISFTSTSLAFFQFLLGIIEKLKALSLRTCQEGFYDASEVGLHDVGIDQTSLIFYKIPTSVSKRFFDE